MNSPLSVSDILQRVFAAVAAGALVGLERESHGRPAGLRTTILACTASAVAMMVSESYYLQSMSVTPGAGWHPDPARLSVGILTGIGFLGAGTIMRHEHFIRGVTTAASLWFVTVLGLAFGTGLFGLGALGVVIALITLLVLPGVETKLRTDWYAKLIVTTNLSALSEEQLASRVRELGLTIIRMDLDHDVAAGRKTVSYELKMQKKQAADLSTRVVAMLDQCPGILRVQWT